MPNSSSSSSSSTSSSFWAVSFTKLQFFARIRRYLRSKSSRKRCQPSDQFGISKTKSEAEHHNNRVEKLQTVRVKQKQSESSEEEEEECAILLQRSVKKLHFGNWEEKEVAAKDIEILAKQDVKARKLITELGVVPVLVSMAASDVASRRRSAVKALIQLANGSFTNKALIVEAGMFSKLPKRIDPLAESTRSEIAELVLSLSCLANTQFPFASLDFLPFLRDILQSSSTLPTKKSCLGALYNLSTVLDNAGPLVSEGNIIHILLELSSVKELSEKALASLGNLVVTLMGKKAIEQSPMVPESLIEILSWEDKPKCQEISAYVLMILAHQSSSQREKMAEAGIIPVLLEVALMGSTLAQKRAMKLLQWFKDERQVKMGPHSGPQTPRVAAMGSPVSPREGKEGKRMMKNLVKQSLYRNLEIITERANVAAGESSKLKSLVISASSKSLPY